MELTAEQHKSYILSAVTFFNSDHTGAQLVMKLTNVCVFVLRYTVESMLHSLRCLRRLSSAFPVALTLCILHIHSAWNV